MAHSEYFILNKDKELEINKPEVKKVPEYKALFDRDKGNKATQMLACDELFYIYLVHDVRSKYYNLDLEEKKIKAKKDAKLPDKWKEDEKLENAVIRYKEDFKLSSSGNAYAVAERAAYTMSEDTSIMQDNLIRLKREAQGKLNKLQSDTIGELEKATIINEYLAIVSNITKIQKDILTNIKEFKGLNKLVKDLAIEFAEDGGSLRVVVGGGTVGNREE